jgi:sterol desaturase/sphingolipid hydroxylase (fatty acid hydroxylase superfamily)
MNLFTIEQTRAVYRADFVFYGLVIAGLTLTLIVGSPPAARGKLAFWVLATLAGWTLLEYVVHRFVLHGIQPFRRWHAAHHASPGDLICAPTILTASIIAGCLFMPVWAFADVWLACSATLGLLLGYFAYAVTHHATHHWRGSGGWLRRRRQWHLVHHHERLPCCYGVTSGFWDHVFGSIRLRRAVRVD